MNMSRTRRYKWKEERDGPLYLYRRTDGVVVWEADVAAIKCWYISLSDGMYLQKKRAKNTGPKARPVARRWGSAQAAMLAADREIPLRERGGEEGTGPE